MATILTHSVDSPLINKPLQHTVTFSDVDFTNILAYLAVHYTPVNGVAPPPDQCLLQWLQDAINSMMTNVHAWQLTQVSTPSVPNISPTVT